MNKKNKIQKKTIICKTIIPYFYFKSKKYFKIKISSMNNNIVSRKIKKQIKKDIFQIDKAKELFYYLNNKGLFF